MIVAADFVGKYRISTKSGDLINHYIVRYEDRLILDLFGKDLGQTYIDDPDDSQWDDVNAIGFGLKSMLVGMIYFEFVRDLPYKLTNQGVVYTAEENGGVVIPALMLRQRYNECVTDWKEMQTYLKENFSQFDGKPRNYIAD